MSVLYVLRWILISQHVCHCFGLSNTERQDFLTIKHRLWVSKIPIDGKATYAQVPSIIELMNDNGSFEDLDYENSLSSGSSVFFTHSKRLNILSQSYHINDTKNEWFHSSLLRSKVELGYDYITYKAPPNDDQNWWGHQIGVPLNMYTGLVLMERGLSKTLLIDTLRRYWLETKVWDVGDTGGANGGSNFAYRAYLGKEDFYLVLHGLRSRKNTIMN